MGQSCQTGQEKKERRHILQVSGIREVTSPQIIQIFKKIIREEDTQMANRYMQRCSTSLIMRDVNQNHNDLTLVRMAVIKRT